MEGAPVTGEPSDGDNSEAVSLVETFRKLCPMYMVMGMTYDQFWHCNTVVHKAYREAWEIHKQNDEWSRWRQGAYFYDALLRVAPVMRSSMSKTHVEPGKYPDEPWPLTEKEAKERELRRERENTERFIKQLEIESERNIKRLNEMRKEASEDGRN